MNFPCCDKMLKASNLKEERFILTQVSRAFSLRSALDRGEAADPREQDTVQSLWGHREAETDRGRAWKPKPPPPVTYFLQPALPSDVQCINNVVRSQICQRIGP